MKRPRKVMLMVKAGKAVDGFIEQLIPYLEPGDIISTVVIHIFQIQSEGQNLESKTCYYRDRCFRWRRGCIERPFHYAWRFRSGMPTVKPISKRSRQN